MKTLYGPRWQCIFDALYGTGKTGLSVVEFSRNTQSWQRWHFVLLIFENKQDREISHFCMNPKHLGKC